VPIHEKLFLVRVIAFIGIISGAGVVSFLVIQSGKSNLLEVASYYSALRYLEGVGIPIEVRILNVFLYFSVIVSILVYLDHKYHGRRKVLYLLPAFFLFFESLLTGTKSIVVMIAVFFIVLLNVIDLYYGRKNSLIKFVKVSLGFFVILLSLTILVHFIRAKGNMDVISILIKIFTSYFTIPSFAFYTKLSEVDKIFDLNFYSISGLSVYLIDGLVKQGEYISMIIDGVELETNVYTALYYLIIDLGMVGFIIFYFLLMLLAVYLEKKIQYRSIWVLSLYIPLGCYFVFAFADPLFKEFTFVLVFIALFFYFMVASWLSFRRKIQYKGYIAT